MEAAQVEDEVLQLGFCKCGNFSCLSVLLIFVNIMYPFSNWIMCVNIYKSKGPITNGGQRELDSPLLYLL